MVDPKNISSDLVQEMFTDALASRCGPGKEISVSKLAEATGIKECTINAWRGRDTTACLSKVLQLGAVLGPGFINDVFGLAGLGGMKRLDAPDQPDSFGINADLSATLAMFGRHLADGRFDHLELAEQRRALGALAEDLSQWLAAYDRRQDATEGTVTSLRAARGA